jgi:hypothetical protein
MNIKFDTVPSTHLKTEEDLRAAMLKADAVAAPHTGNFSRGRTPNWLETVRCEYTISVIREMEAADSHVSNPEVEVEMRKRLGYSAYRHNDRQDDADWLSWVIYCCRDYSRNDQLQAAGYVEGTQAHLEEAFAKGLGIETTGGTVLTVRQVNGKLYAFKPRKRNEGVQIVGSPIRMLPKKTAAAVKAAKNAMLQEASVKGVFVIEIAGGRPAELDPNTKELVGAVTF